MVVNAIDMDVVANVMDVVVADCDRVFVDVAIVAIAIDVVFAYVFDMVVAEELLMLWLLLFLRMWLLQTVT